MKRKRIPGFNLPVYETKILTVDGIEIVVNFKKVKNLRMVAKSHDGRIQISAPHFLNMSDVKSFVVSKKNWIKKAHEKYKKQTTLNTISFESGSEVPFLGKNFPLKLDDCEGRAYVTLGDGEIQMLVNKYKTDDFKQKLLEKWYRKELKYIAKKLLIKWEPVIGIKVAELRIKKMKTRWGTCNTKAKRIWLNLELVCYSIDIIEHILVHEMIHFFEKGHNKRFYSFMTKLLPDWKKQSQILKNNC